MKITQLLPRAVGWALAVLLSLNAAHPAHAVLGHDWPGFNETFGLQPERVAQDYEAREIAASAPANVFYPGDKAGFTFQFVNKTDRAISATGKLEVIAYGSTSDPSDSFAISYHKVADLSSTPLRVVLPAKGFQDITVTPDIPQRFGAYVLVIELNGLKRQFGAACVRVPVAARGKVQYPSFALDLQGWNAKDPALAELFQRCGIKATRMEIGYMPTTDPGFAQRWEEMQRLMKIVGDHDISLMMTSAAPPGNIQPLGGIRHWLDDTDTAVANPPQGDMAWLPQYDADYQKWIRLMAGSFGWPKGPINAIELWNEPWEGISISGWGADIPRYREIYTRMAQGVETARREDGVQVLIGGACSSMNTEDKLFPDGKDDFLKWLDFTSIHYQPLGAWPALKPEWRNRQSPLGPVRVWDTESWVANSEDRVAGVIASMRAQGQERTAGVLHDQTYDVQRFDRMTATGKTPTVVVQAWAPAAAIAATQQFLGERHFKELLFQNGLPWVFAFDGLNNNADDGTLVVVGDLGGIYERERLLWRSLKVFAGDF